MLQLIEHPQHGRMHVYSPYDLERHIAMGWKPVQEAVQVEKKRETLHLPKKPKAK